MNDVTGESHSPDRTRRKTRRRLSDEEVAARRRKQRNNRIVCGAAILTVAGFAGWLGYEGLQAKSSLEEAQEYALRAKNALLSGDTEKAARAADDANKYAQDAKSSADSIPWRIASAVPWLGSPFDSTRQMTSIVSGLTHDVLVPAVDAGSAVSPDQLILDGARINLTALRDAAPVLETTAAAISDLEEQANNVGSTYIGVIDDARTDLRNQVAELSGLLNNTATAAKIAPAMLGADGPRSYFIGFQTNAEARGTGGLLGAYGVVRASGGGVQVGDLSSRDFAGTYTPIDLGPEFAQAYNHSSPTARAVNSNVSSHFPYAAQIWQSLWQQESGDRVDGVIATDPVALSYVLEVIGPIALPGGEVVNADNIVELTESTTYVRFADDNDARKDYLQTVASQVIQEMTGKISNPRALLDALGRAASEGRLSLWSADPSEQGIIETTPLGHIVPDDAAPYAGVVVNNLGGNKLDYYLQREIEYSAGSCAADVRESTVTVRLTNLLPGGNHPAYVAGMFDNPIGAPFGTNLTDVGLLATQGAKLDRVEVDGRPVFTFNSKERGHPLFTVQIPIHQGDTVEIIYHLTEPIAPGAARVPIQPLVDEPLVTVNVPACG